MFAPGVGAAHPGKSFVQVSTSQVFFAHILHHRPKEPVLFLALPVRAGLEVFIPVPGAPKAEREFRTYQCPDRLPYTYSVPAGAGSTTLH